MHSRPGHSQHRKQQASRQLSTAAHSHFVLNVLDLLHCRHLAYACTSLAGQLRAKVNGLCTYDPAPGGTSESVKPFSMELDGLPLSQDDLSQSDDQACDNARNE